MQMLLLFIFLKQQVLMALINRREKKEKIRLLKRKQILNKALQKNYAQLKAAHIKDYQSLFKRVELNLGVDHTKSKTTN